MQFRPYQKRSLDIHYAYQNCTLECVNSFPLLGIHIDTNINWKEHINAISAKLSRFTYALYELKKCTDKKTAISAYYAYAHAWLKYGIVLWGNSPHALQLFKLQKRCIRILVNIDSRTSCKNHFKEQKILTLASMYILEVCIFVRKNMSLIPQYNRPSNLRQKNRLAVPASSLKMIHTAPFAMSIKIFNKISEEIKQENNMNIFKHRLKTFLSEKSYYSVQDFLDEN